MVNTTDEAKFLANDFASGIRAFMKRDDGPNVIGHAWSRERWLQLAEMLTELAEDA